MAKKKKKTTDYSALIAACDTGTSMVESKPLRHIKLQGFPCLLYTSDAADE